MRWLILTGLIFYFCLIPACTSTKHDAAIPFFETDKPIVSMGIDDELKRTGNYQSISTFVVDNNQNTYITDESRYAVDKYDKNGKYLMSIGGIQSKTVGFPRWLNVFTVDSRERLIAYCSIEKSFLVFSPDGSEFKTFKLNSDLKKFEIRKLKTNREDHLYMLGYSRESGARLFRYDIESGHYNAIHSDQQHVLNGALILLPDFALDETGHIYIHPIGDYRIYKYSPQGLRLTVFSKKVEKNRLKKTDCYHLAGPGKLRKIQGWDEAWEAMNESSRCLPAIFGIHVDGQRMYVWTSRKDKEKKFLIDVYDLNFQWIGQTSCYNSLLSPMVCIQSGRVVVPDIGTDDHDLKNAAGWLGLFNFPHKIDVYGISTTLIRNRVSAR
ncbi:MAG: hypothetical protein ACM3SY_11820 [Candidatus Omnitrophota bacterium]